LDLEQGPFPAFGDPRINDLLVKSPNPADPNRWNFACFGQLAYGDLMQSQVHRQFFGCHDLRQNRISSLIHPTGLNPISV
jgi:hypothetical protein